jgi:hypothetical protein
MLNFYGLVFFAPRLKKTREGYHPIWEANLQPFGPDVPAFIYLLIMFLNVNILAFISNLGPNQTTNQKNAQSWPQVFWALTPIVSKVGLIMYATASKKFTNPCSRPIISVHGILLILFHH